jgi:ureidoacrylate peracid hydrolase
MPSVLMSRAEKLDPNRSALVVIDVQNDFCSVGGVADREDWDLSMIREMLPRLVDLVGNARSAALPIVWVRSAYGTNGNHYLSAVWLDRAARSASGAHIAYRVCEPGTWGAELCEGLGVGDPNREALITKHRYSAFFQTELELMLRAKDIQTVVLTGVTSNVCVETTARDAFMRDFYVVVVEDACAAYRVEEHKSALDNVRRYFGEVLSSPDVTEIWSGLHGAAS